MIFVNLSTRSRLILMLRIMSEGEEGRRGEEGREGEGREQIEFYWCCFYLFSFNCLWWVRSFLLLSFICFAHLIFCLFKYIANQCQILSFTYRFPWLNDFLLLLVLSFLNFLFIICLFNRLKLRNRRIRPIFFARSPFISLTDIPRLLQIHFICFLPWHILLIIILIIRFRFYM